MSISISFINQTQQAIASSEKAAKNYLTIGEVNSLELIITNEGNESIELTKDSGLGIDFSSVQVDLIESADVNWKIEKEESMFWFYSQVNKTISPGKSLSISMTKITSKGKVGTYSLTAEMENIGSESDELPISLIIQPKALKGDQPLDLLLEWQDGGQQVTGPIGFKFVQTFTISTKGLPIPKGEKSALWIAFDEGYGAGQMPHANLDLDVNNNYGISWKIIKQSHPSIGWKLWIPTSNEDILFEASPNNKLELKLTLDIPPSTIDSKTGKTKVTSPGVADLKVMWDNIPGYQPDSKLLLVKKHGAYLLESNILDPTTLEPQQCVIPQSKDGFKYVVDITNNPVDVKFSFRCVEQELKNIDAIVVGDRSIGSLSDRPSDMTFTICAEGIKSSDGKLIKNLKIKDGGSPMTPHDCFHQLDVQVMNGSQIQEKRILRFICVKFKPPFGKDDNEKNNLEGLDFIKYDFSKNKDTYSLEGANLKNANLTASDLTKVNMKNANLAGADLRGADLSQAVLSKANLQGTIINHLTKMDKKWRLVRSIQNGEVELSSLRGTDLSGADLTGIDFSGVNLEKTVLNKANLQGVNLTKTILTGAILKHANLKDAILTGADLTDANLYKANLSGADLTNAILSNSDLSANLQGAILCGANLNGAILRHANLRGTKINGLTKIHSNWHIVWSLQNAKKVQSDLSELYLVGADLSGCDLSGANLKKTNLSGANLVNAILYKTNLTKTDLTEADLTGAKLDMANFERTKINVQTKMDSKWRLVWSLKNGKADLSALSGKDLSNAYLQQCDFSEGNLSEANLSGANLSKVTMYNTNLTKANLTGAIVSDAAVESANFKDATLIDVNFKGMYDFDFVNFKGAKLNNSPKMDKKMLLIWSLQNGLGIPSAISSNDLIRVDLTRVDLSGCNLSNISLTENAQMYLSNLTDANLTGANLSKATLNNANLTNAVLIKTILIRTDLTDAILTGAKLNSADLSNTRLNATQLTGADLTGVTFKGNTIDYKTKWPEGFNPNDIDGLKDES